MMAGWGYSQFPSLQSLKPTIERYVQQQLNLKELRLGELSWYWAGFLWLQVDDLEFISADNKLAFHHGSASVRIPITSLYSGTVTPDRIRLSDGTLDMEIGASSASALANQLLLENVNLNWRYDNWHGRLPKLSLTLDGADRSLQVISPAFNLSAQLDKDGYPRHLKFSGQHTDWLPERLLGQISGDPDIEIELQRHDALSWRVDVSIASEQALTVMPETLYTIELNRMHARANVDVRQDHAFQMESIVIDKLNWTLGENRIDAQGQWQDGVLKLEAKSDHLGMPLIWSWLRPLGEKDWQHWLSLMESGVASHVKASVTLPWAEPMYSWPETEAWDAMQYHLQAEVDDADLALGLSDDALLHSRVQLNMDQQGLLATFLDTELPRNLGHASGKVEVPWDTLELHISGHSIADVAALLQWFGPESIADWEWHDSRANSTFRLLWDPNQSTPKQAGVTLHPEGDWHVTVQGEPLQLSGGEVQWDQDTGLVFRDMHVNGEHFDVGLSLAMAPAGETWNIISLNASGKGDMAPLAAYFQMPLDHAGGTVSSDLSFDGQWSGTLDLQDASWAHLLGSSKKAGDPLLFRCQGALDLKGKLTTIHLNQLTSQGNNTIKLQAGSASINRDGLKAQLKGVHTPSFSGSLDVDVPFGSKRPWKIDVYARYLNRNALPESLDYSGQPVDKDWQLRADIDQFDWDGARMSGVHIRMSSNQGSVGILEAAQIHTSRLDIMDVDARFSLMGQGRVELRKLSASVEKQHLTMSATLSPNQGGGMQWRGFAELSGDFGHMMKFSEFSSRFLKGESHIIFSGKGVILRDQPWWQGLDGRLRMRVDKGRILEGGSITTLLSVINLSKLPALLVGQREDITGPGLMYQRLQMEAIMQNQNIRIRNMVMRSSAIDVVGRGELDVQKALIDLYLIVKPLQNLDALISKIPLLRDVLGGRSHSLMSKVYHMYGPFADAKVEQVEPESAGFVERLMSLPNAWFGSGLNKKEAQPVP
ncbi:MAG: AsmA-like C-terminal domain-containing protein [Mariprofundus sp.]